MSFLIWFLVMAAASIGGYYVVRAVLWLAQRPLTRKARRSGAQVPASDGPDGATAQHVLRGGLWIGLLERALISGFIMAGFPTGIAIVVAIKGLGRYPELTKDNPHAAERFMIGTLASLLIAALAGWAGQHYLSVV